MPALPTRAEVPRDETWDLAAIYPSPAAWEGDLQRVEADLDRLSTHRGRLAQGAGALLAFLHDREAAAERFDRVYPYAALSLDADGASPANQALYARATALSARFAAAQAFAVPELLALPPGTVEGYLAAEPTLAPYRQLLEGILRRRGHVLAPEGELALAALDELTTLPCTIWQRITGADLACPPLEGSERPMSLARWRSLSASPDRDLRRRAFASLAAGLARHQHTLAASLAAHIQGNSALARLRGYGSAVEMVLAAQEVPEAVYRRILEALHGVAPHLRRLGALRRRTLGLERLHYYDLAAPLDPTPGPSLTYNEGRELVLEGLAPLGEEYAAILEAAFRDRWIDRADNPGKGPDSYCAWAHNVHPYVLVTWHGDVGDAALLAHELGHAVHAMLAGRAQLPSNNAAWSSAPGLTPASSLFFVEAPSSAAQLLVQRHLVDTAASPALRRRALLQLAGMFATLMGSCLAGAHLEQRLYDLAEEGEAITTEAVNAAQVEILAELYGDEVELDEGAELMWVDTSQFYDSLYLYTYTAGLAIANGVVERIREEGRPALERWLASLRAGSTLPPLDLARLAGVDLSGPAPLERAIACLASLVDELEYASGPPQGS